MNHPHMCWWCRLLKRSSSCSWFWGFIPWNSNGKSLGSHEDRAFFGNAKTPKREYTVTLPVAISGFMKAHMSKKSLLMDSEWWHRLRNMRKDGKKSLVFTLKWGQACSLTSHKRYNLGFPGSSFSVFLSFFLSILPNLLLSGSIFACCLYRAYVVAFPMVRQGSLLNSFKAKGDLLCHVLKTWGAGIKGWKDVIGGQALALAGLPSFTPATPGYLLGSLGGGGTLFLSQQLQQRPPRVINCLQWGRCAPEGITGPRDMQCFHC